MKCIETELPEVLLFQPQLFCDERGFFMETFRQTVFDWCLRERGLNTFVLVQDNQSRSQKMSLGDYITN